MIAIMTNEGALEFGRALSGGSRFLVSEAALLNSHYSDVLEAVALTHEDVDMSAGTVDGASIVRTIECTGSLPVSVADGDVSAMAVDFDFNGQAPSGGTTVEYRTVVALGRRFHNYPQVLRGVTYHRGDHVWLNESGPHTAAYTCIVDELEYTDALPTPDNDPDNWMATPMSDLIRHPQDPDFFSDPDGDVIPFFVTSYDDSIVMANGLEWEYKVRVFLDNVATTELPRLNYFSKGGLEANGSLMLSFIAEMSNQFRQLRDLVTTAT